MYCCNVSVTWWTKSPQTGCQNTAFLPYIVLIGILAQEVEKELQHQGKERPEKEKRPK